MRVEHDGKVVEAFLPFVFWKTKRFQFGGYVLSMEYGKDRYFLITPWTRWSVPLHVGFEEVFQCWE